MRKNTKKVLTDKEKLKKWDEYLHQHNLALGRILCAKLNWLDTYKELEKYYYNCKSILEKQAYLETLRNAYIILYDADDPLCDAPVRDLPIGMTYVVGVADALDPNDIKYSDGKKNKISSGNLENILSKITSTQKSDFDIICTTGYLYKKYYTIISKYLKPIFEKKIFNKKESESDTEEVIDMDSLNIWLIKDGEIRFKISSNLNYYYGYYFNVPGGEITISTQDDQYDLIFDSRILESIKDW